MDDSSGSVLTEYLDDYARRAPGNAGLQRRVDPQTNEICEFSLEFDEGGLCHRLVVIPVLSNGKPAIRAKYFIAPLNA